jgi:hypothetical protein
MTRAEINKEFEKAAGRAFFKAKQLLMKKNIKPSYDQIAWLAEQIKYDIYLNKSLFNLTYNFKPEDWRYFRTQKYWSLKDQLQTDRSKNEYTLRCVKYYLEIINQQKQKT